MLIISRKIFCHFISNHFELENGVKVTPKRRSFLSALFFTSFCITKPLLTKIRRVIKGAMSHYLLSF